MDPSRRVTTALSVHAVDQQGHVYISGADDIHRLSTDGTFHDIVLSKHDGVDEPWSITLVIKTTISCYLSYIRSICI
jgi:hypothetical protein